MTGLMECLRWPSQYLRALSKLASTRARLPLESADLPARRKIAKGYHPWHVLVIITIVIDSNRCAQKQAVV